MSLKNPHFICFNSVLNPQLWSTKQGPSLNSLGWSIDQLLLVVIQLGSGFSSFLLTETKNKFCTVPTINQDKTCQRFNTFTAHSIFQSISCLHLIASCITTWSHRTLLSLIYMLINFNVFYSLDKYCTMMPLVEAVHLSFHSYISYIFYIVKFQSIRQPNKKHYPGYPTIR